MNKDCIFFKNQTCSPDCAALEKLYCKEDARCSFYKSRKLYKADGIKRYNVAEISSSRF